MNSLRPLLPLVALAVMACGGAAQPAPSATAQPTSSAATPPPTATATAAPASAPAVSGAVTFTISTGSKATVRINEQLADRTLPNDAVLETDRVSGEFTLRPDGTFAPTSRIVVDLDSLQSDSGLRDGTVKRSVLDTRRFPHATFVPTRAEGLQLPLPATGEQTFKLIGDMTIRGVTKELVFEVKSAHSAGDLRATANVTPAFQFSTFGMTQPRVLSVISITDEIRLEVQVVAKRAGL